MRLEKPYSLIPRKMSIEYSAFESGLVDTGLHDTAPNWKFKYLESCSR